MTAKSTAKERFIPKLSLPWEGPYVVYGIQRAPRAKPKAVHRDRPWKYRGEERAHYFTEAPEEPVGGGVPEETPMQQETLASDYNRNALPRRRSRRRELPLSFRGNRFRASNANFVQEGSRRSQRSRSTPQGAFAGGGSRGGGAGNNF